MLRLVYKGSRQFHGNRKMPGIVLNRGDKVDVPEWLALELVSTGRFEYEEKENREGVTEDGGNQELD